MGPRTFLQSQRNIQNFNLRQKISTDGMVVGQDRKASSTIHIRPNSVKKFKCLCPEPLNFGVLLQVLDS